MTLLSPLMNKVVISMDFTNLRIEKGSFSIQVSLIYQIVSIGQKYHRSRTQETALKEFF